VLIKLGTNVQTFTGSLGGPAPPVIFTAGAARPFAVDGTTDINKAAALQRSCDVQHNACANAANSGALSGGEGPCETQHAACLAAASVAKRAALDFGTCTDPAIVFGAGFDGRNQDSFEPANKASFNHGSALNIGVITSFICGQLQSACKAGADAISACATGQAAAAAATGQAAADAFNAALGVSAGAASSAAASSVASPVATSTPVAVACAAPATTTAATAAAPATTSTAAVSGTNVQAFTGTLGGAAPPVIFTAGAARPFAVDGTTDINKAAALQRSCDVQHNACANAANSGALSGGEGPCETQHAACLAAASA
jgi:hypothetical protein